MQSQTEQTRNLEANEHRSNDEKLLATLGYKQEFKRDFSPLEVFGLGFSIVGILPSIASVLAFSIPNGGPVVMVWGWAVCSFFLMFIALAVAELGSAAPTAGGIYYWTFKFSPPRYRNYLCWVAGYINSLTYISAVAGVDWGCAVQIMAVATIGSGGTFVPTAYHIFGAFVALVFCHGCVCSLATKVIAKLQNIYVIVNVAISLVVIIGLPAATPAEIKNDASFAFGHLENLSLWPNGFAFILGFLAPLWAVGGFDSTVHISEEAQNASVAVPWAIVWSTSLSCALGWALNVAMAFNMGQDMVAIVSNPIGQPMATIFFNSFGTRGTLALWSFIILAQFMMGTSILTTSSRQIFAFSRDGALPFSKLLYYISPSQGVPIRCVWFSVSISFALGLIALAGPAASGAIFALGVVGQYTANSLVISARWLGGQEFVPGPFNLGPLSLPVSIVAVSFMCFMAIVLLFPAEPQVTANDMNYTVLVIGGTILFSTIYYFFPKYGGVHWFHGPVVTLSGDDNSMEDVDSVTVDSKKDNDSKDLDKEKN